MKKYKSCIIYLIAIPAVGFMSYFYQSDNSSAFGDLVTFLSIIIGFTITALSIIATSNLSQKLYNKELKNDNSKTLLHKLVDKFKYSTILFTFIIALILIYQFDNSSLFQVKILDKAIESKTIFRSLIWYLSLFAFVEFISLFNLFSKFIIKGIAKG